MNVSKVAGLSLVNVHAEASMTNEAYHEMTWDSISNSRLSLYRYDPQKFYRVFIDKSEPRESTDDMDFGKSFHSVVLERQTMIDIDSINSGVLGVFRPCLVPNRPADVVTDEEELWLIKSPVNGVVRRSRFWGDVGDNCWILAGSDKGVGYADWRDLHRNGEHIIHIPSHVLSAAGRKQGKAWDTFCDDNADRGHLMSPNEWSRLLKMRAEIHDHRLASELLFDSSCVSEFTIVGTDEETGLEVRTRIDKYRIGNGRVKMTDLKSTRDSNPSRWQRQARSDGLHIQCALMMALAYEHFKMPIEYRYVVVDKRPRHRCVVFTLENEFIELGFKDLRETLREFRKSADTHWWYPRDHGREVILRTPASAMDDAIQWMPVEGEDLDAYNCGF